jgi:hypothetical protein
MENAETAPAYMSIAKINSTIEAVWKNDGKMNNITAK